MRIYYAHPINNYGTNSERNEIALIQSAFKGSTIVNPSNYESGAAKRVYELQNQQFIAITKPVKPISIEQSRKLLRLSVADLKGSIT
jgi:hypothetical protein